MLISGHKIQCLGFYECMALCKCEILRSPSGLVRNLYEVLQFPLFGTFSVFDSWDNLFIIITVVHFHD